MSKPLDVARTLVGILVLWVTVAFTTQLLGFRKRMVNNSEIRRLYLVYIKLDEYRILGYSTRC